MNIARRLLAFLAPAALAAVLSFLLTRLIIRATDGEPGHPRAIVQNPGEPAPSAPRQERSGSAARLEIPEPPFLTHSRSLRLEARDDFVAAFLRAKEGSGSDRAERIEMALKIGIEEDPQNAFALFESLSDFDKAQAYGLWHPFARVDASRTLAMGISLFPVGSERWRIVMGAVGGLQPVTIFNYLAGLGEKLTGEPAINLTGSLRGPGMRTATGLYEALDRIPSVTWRSGLAAATAKGLAAYGRNSDAERVLDLVANEDEKAKLKAELSESGNK